MANKVEQVHMNLFERAAEALNSGKQPPSVDYLVCGVCGNTVEGEAPDKCPICGAPKAKFFKMA